LPVFAITVWAAMTGGEPRMPRRQTGEGNGRGDRCGGAARGSIRSSSATLAGAKVPSKLGSMARMRSVSGGWVSRRWKKDWPMPLPKNMWLASVACAAWSFEP
jgi:hypothetical protein